jgi:NADP-dependent 3-hydroxy acid dehydrogenase YdfG
MISSPAGIKSNPTAPLYCTSKFALEGYTDGLRQQTDSWKKEGINIRITNIKPGSVDSGYWGKRDVPRPKFMTCEEMASALFWAVATKNTMNIYDIRMESRR